ncbi:MAG: hypothetical protein WCE75_10545 [Terracidiphilus sp.]
MVGRAEAVMGGVEASMGRAEAVGGQVEVGALRGPGLGQGAQPRLVHAAHEFEAQMMKELLGPLTEGDGLTGEEKDAGGGALSDFARDALGRGISEQGGLGIARSILHSLSGSGNAHAPTAVTAGTNRNTEMKSPK